MLHIVRIAGHTFVGDWVRPDSAVLDFGMNHAAFCQRMVELYDCHVHGAEAHPGLCEKLPRHPHIHARNIAISGGPGVLKLSLYSSHCASGVLSQLEAGAATVDVPTVGLGAFCEQAGVADVALLKCDIEGSELAMLAAASDEQLLRLGQITIEFHDFLDAAQQPAVLAQIERLERLGFWAIDMSKNRMDVLLINQRRHPLGVLGKAQIAWLKYWRALRRVVQRRFGIVDTGEDGYRDTQLQQGAA
jgi:FkbM family methyltransferase